MFEEENAPSNPFEVNRANSSEESVNPFERDENQSSEGYSDLVNPFAVDRQQPGKTDLLTSAKERKLKALSKLDNKASLDDSFTDMGNGWLESNSNKLWNDMSGQEIQSLLNHSIKNYALNRNEQGDLVDAKGNFYGGKTRRLYDFGTKAQTSDAVKFGLARGDAEDSTARYIKDRLETGYGWDSGELGVDTARLNSDTLLPNNIAVMLEAAIHGRKGALENRAVKDRYADPELTNLYGGGSSEYYTSRAGALGELAEIDEGMGSKLFQEYMDKLPERYRKRGDKDSDRSHTIFDELAQTVSALPAGIAKGAIELVDAAQEGLTYLPQLAVRMTTGDSNYDIDLFNDGLKESVIEYVDDLTGYDRAKDTAVIEEAHNQIKAAGIDITSLDSIVEGFADPKKRELLGDAALTILSDPSLTMSMITEVFGSGLGLGAATKIGSKLAPKLFEAFESNSSKIKTALEAASKSKDLSKIKELEKSYTFGKKAGDLLRGSVFTNADMAVRMNNDITAFKENNNGDSPDNFKLFEMAALNRMVSTAEVISLKSLLGLKNAPADAVKKAVKDGVIVSAGKVIGKTLKGGATEGVQETVDSIVEQLNQKLGSSDWEGKTASEILSEASADILTGTVAGIASGVQISGVSSLAKETLGKVSGMSESLLEKRDGAPTPIPTTEQISKVSVDEVKAAKVAYGSLLSSVQNAVLNEGINEKNVATLLDDLDELNVTKYIIKSSSPEQVSAGEKAYEGVVTRLEDFVKANPNLKLTKRVVRKSVEDSLNDSSGGSTSTPDNIKTAFQTLSAALGNGEVSDYGVSAKDVIKKFNKGDYKTVVPKGSDIVPELQALELAITGKVSENLVETFDNIKYTLKGKKIEDFSDKSSSSDTVLGSKPAKEFTADEELDYDDFTRRLVAERITHVVLGSGRNHSEDLKEKVAAFAAVNGVNKERYDDIIKGYTSVEDEATVGPRGYISRLNRLNSIIASSNPNEKEASKEYSSLMSMYAAIANSEQQLSRGIAGAVEKAKELNRLKVPSTGKKKQYTTEYVKDDGKAYVMWIEKVGGKWVANTKGATDLKNRKAKYSSDIKSGLRKAGERNSGKIKAINTQPVGVAIPVKEGKYKEQRKKDAKHISSVNEIVADIIPENNGVNKIILGEDVDSKWSPKSDYYKANALIVNNTEFSSDDVVLINSTGTNGTAKSYSPKFGDAAKLAIEAAAEAGATFVLDISMSDYYGKNKNPLAAGAIYGYLVKGSKGYTELREGNKRIFIKETPENAKRLRARKTTAELSNIVSEAKSKDKSELVNLYRSIQSGVNPKNGTDLSANAVKVLTSRFTTLEKTVVDDSFNGSKTNLDLFLKRQSQDDVVEAATGILNDSNPDVIDYKDKAFQKAVEEYISKEQQKDIKGMDTLKSWNEISTDIDQSRKRREDELSKLLDSQGLKPKSLIDKIFGDNSFVKGKKDLYEKVYMNVHNKETHVKPLRKQPDEAAFAKLEAEELKIGGYKHVFVGVRRVVQDVTKLADVNKTTVLNSMPVEYLPFGLRNAVDKFTKNAKDTLAKVSDAEMQEQTDVRGPKGFMEGNLYLHNSPARGLFFDNEGSVNSEVMAAMYVALGNIMVTDSVKWSRGYKADVEVAKMFGVQEFELTYDMRKFAYSHGTLLKTAATSIGKDLLTQLGITKRKDDATSSHEYEAFIADVGNTALLIAEEQGLLETKTEKSNTIATLYKDGEIKKIDTDTHFIHFSDKEVKNGKYVSYETNTKVGAFKEVYEEVVEVFPETVTDRVGPFFTEPGPERLDKAMNTVRNDISGKEVPIDAQETIKHLMETPYTVDLDRVTELLDAVDAKGSNIKKLLGYVDVTSEDYKKLYFKEKEVQEGVNRDVEKSIKELQNLKDYMISKSLEKTDMYFDYFYSGNDRYMLDSNTINPQTDKLHRFLVVPSGHKLDYNVKLSEGASGGVLFDVSGVSNPVDGDQSYTVRMALAQAFGASVDKMKSEDIIDFGNAVLSMDKYQIAEARKAILDKGKFEIVVDGSDIEIDHKTDKTISDIEQEGEAEHLTHTLQGLAFLDSVQDALAGSGKMTSSLSLEFDSLTSGFANKTQQMPILKDMVQHFARTGVLTKEYQDILAAADNFGGKGVAFSSNEHSVSDVIATGKDKKINPTDEVFRDSYVNMANTTVLMLRSGEKQNQNLSTVVKGYRSGKSVFDIIKPMLPGGDSIDSADTEIEITSIIRNLFKNPFMIFNYSAGIARIVKNLGSDVAHGITKSIAKADLAQDKNAGILAVAENLVEKFDMHYVDNITEAKVSINTANDLQDALRNVGLSSIKLNKPVRVGNPNLEKQVEASKNLEHMLETTVSLTYGAVVDDVFKANFKPFIDVQDAMNDAFKVSFRIFDKKRMDMLKELQKSKPEHFLSLEDHADVLESLWKDFPWIVGPLTGKDDSVSKRDVIAVVTSGTRPSNPIEESRKKPQAMLSGKHDKLSRTATPLVKYLEEAVSSGSVLPFHAIDGAEISVMFSEMKIRSMAAIHDAVIPPLNMSDHAGFQYNKGMSKINTEYVLAEALRDLVKRMEKTINSPKFDKEFKDVTVKGIKVTQKDEGITFDKAAKTVVSALSQQVKIIMDSRKEWYGDGNTKGKLEDAWVGNLVGTPGGMYKRGMTGPDLSYKDRFKSKYKSHTVIFKSDEKVVAENKEKPVTIVDEKSTSKEDRDALSGGVKLTDGCKT